MDKLIKLLNEYEYSRFEDKSLATERGHIEDWIVFEKDFCEDLDNPRDLTMSVTHLISRRFGFIKRLDKHNKIDRTYKKNLNYPYYIRKRDGELKGYKRYEMLTMLLSISDKPIDFLISMLK